jgi:hypothetical protein
VSEPMPESPPEPANPPAEGPIEHVADWFHNHGAHAEAEAGHIAADVNAALRDHAGVVFDVAGDFFAVLKLIDPADAPLIAAAEALLPKVLTMVEKATALASATLNHS